MEQNLSLETKIMLARQKLLENMKKSGKNNFSHYNYFQLQDFIPQIIDICNDLGLYTKFWIDKERVDMPSKITRISDENGVTEIKEENFAYVEYAYLYIKNLENDEEDTYKKETASCSVQGAQPIQNLGSKSTYMKRYMYMDVFEIVENDRIEETTGAPIKYETVVSQPTSQPVVATAPKKRPVKREKVEEAPVVNNETQNTVEEAPVVNNETQNTVDTSEIMSMNTKIELANKMKELGMEPRTVMLEIATELKTDLPLLKESDKDKILEMIEEKSKMLD